MNFAKRMGEEGLLSPSFFLRNPRLWAETLVEELELSIVNRSLSFRN